ncbi:DUF2795 domain-containing protein [Candidatus Nitrosocosmicus sp. SS]|jgi:hypothetical protein|nr:DUF2795 domain-containing protein [Candidatus Nitrosocosmicus sp. SS]KAF0870280.1 DUF2795 domain-containing protein [Candidatus Nitrosocosmicus sp. SS]
MEQVKREQIPDSEGPESKTGQFINRQNSVAGQRKEVNVENYSDVAKLADILKDVSFPAPKSKILQYITQSEDFKNKDTILAALNKLQDRSYNGVSDLTTSAGLVHQ